MPRRSILTEPIADLCEGCSIGQIGLSTGFRCLVCELLTRICQRSLIAPITMISTAWPDRATIGLGQHVAVALQHKHSAAVSPEETSRILLRAHAFGRAL